MISFVRFPAIERAARRALLASMVVLAPMPVFAQGTHGEAPPAPNNSIDSLKTFAPTFIRWARWGGSCSSARRPSRVR